MNRVRQDVVVIEILEEAEGALGNGNIPAARRLLRQGISALDLYAQHRILIDRADRLGLDAPSVVRSIEEWFQERKRLAAGNNEPSGVA